MFQIPIANDLGWFRTEFSLAIAIQNLAWGIATPLFGAFAEKLGDRKAILAGVVIYSLGLSLSSIAATAANHQIFPEILVESVSRVLVLASYSGLLEEPPQTSIGLWH